MDEWLKKLWENNKILFVLLLPLVLILLFKDLLLELLVGSVRVKTKQTAEEDKKLKSEQDAINDAANKLKSEADELGKKAEKVDEREDWNKTF